MRVRTASALLKIDVIRRVDECIEPSRSMEVKRRNVGKMRRIMKGMAVGQMRRREEASRGREPPDNLQGCRFHVFEPTRSVYPGAHAPGSPSATRVGRKSGTFGKVCQSADPNATDYTNSRSQEPTR